MKSENDLMQKLMISKKIMDIHNNVPRGQAQDTINVPNVEDYEAPAAKYNLPQEYMTENKPITSSGPITKDKVMSSRLPDEIKRLMIEHPINQPQQQTQSVLSNDLVEKASRLMKNDVANNVSHFKQPKQQVQENSQNVTSNLDKNMLKNLIKETIEEVLSENGLLTESTSKTNELFQFRVGSHIFEGKVTKIKKVR